MNHRKLDRLIDSTNLTIPDKLATYPTDPDDTQTVKKYPGNVQDSEKPNRTSRGRVSAKRTRILKRKEQIKGHPKSFVSPKNKIMVKTIPLFFSTATEEGDDDSLVNLGESVYTQISKDIIFNNKNEKPTMIYEQMTNDNVIKKAVEMRSGRQKDPEVIKRLYSPSSHEVANEEVRIKQLQLYLNKTESFSSNPNKSYLSKVEDSNEKNKTSVPRQNNYTGRKDTLGNIWNSACAERVKCLNASHERTSSKATSKSRIAEGKVLNNPSIFTENQAANSNFRQRTLKGVKEVPSNSKIRFDKFYKSQLKFVDSKQHKIREQLEIKEQVIEDLRKQRNRFSLLSNGSRKILSRSKQRLDNGLG